MVLDFTGLYCFFFFNLSVFDWVLLGYTGYNLSTVRVSFEYLSSIFRGRSEGVSTIFSKSLESRVQDIYGATDFQRFRPKYGHSVDSITFGKMILAGNYSAFYLHCSPQFWLVETESSAAACNYSLDEITY